MAPDACEISICFFIKRKFYLDKIPIELKENEIWTCIDRGCGCPERLWQKMYPTVRNRCNWVWGTFHNPKGTRTVLFQGHWRICSGMRLKYIFHSKLFFSIFCVKSFFSFLKVPRSLLTWSLCSKMWGCLQCCYC